MAFNYSITVFLKTLYSPPNIVWHSHKINFLNFIRDLIKMCFIFSFVRCIVLKIFMYEHTQTELELLSENCIHLSIFTMVYLN